MLPGKINCLVVEDEQPAQEVMRLHIQRIPLLNLHAVTAPAMLAMRYVLTANLE